MDKRLIIVAGPTASGKTQHAIELAQKYDTEIVSCDSRQIYSELCIGVARPTIEQLSIVKHHFIACRSVEMPYNVFDFEHDAIEIIGHLFCHHDTVIAVGGSGLYIDAIINGIAIMPAPTPELRNQLKDLLNRQGIATLQAMLQEIDPDYYAVVDKSNPIRLQRAIEVSITAGRPYSKIIAEHTIKKRPFDIEVVVMNVEPSALRERINHRVDEMIASGLYEEVRSLWHLQHLNTLNTVGYREFFAYGTPHQAASAISSITEAIKLNTWHYAKKQMTWCKKRYSQRENQF